MRQSRATSPALLGLVFWSTIVAFLRKLVESLGPFPFLVVTSGGGGLLLLLYEVLRRGSVKETFRLDRGYLLVCGPSFVLYFVLFAAAMSLATDRRVAIQVGLVNYLWPALLFLLSLLVLSHRARWWLPAGIVLSLTGAVLATTTRAGDLRSIPQAIVHNAAPFGLMLLATVGWAAYSVFAAKLRRETAANGVAIFHLMVAIVALLLRFLSGESSRLGSGDLPALVYVTVLPTALGYLFWEVGMQHGARKLLYACTMALPVTSTLFACWYLGVEPSTALVAGCCLVALGAILSWSGTVE